MAKLGELCLTAHRISYRSGGRQLLSDVSLTLAPGELTTVIGPNGAGKSTLLRLLTGFFAPSEGECRLNGRPMVEWTPNVLARQRAVMRQDSVLQAPFRVEEVVAMGRSPWPSDATERVLDEILALTDCEMLRGRLYPQLSGGEQQRVRLARSLAQLWRPDGIAGWLFLDEPTSALDLYHQQQLLRLLKMLTSTGKLAVCCVLHDLNLASLWSDKIVLLHDGRIVAEGVPEGVITQPAIERWYQADVVVSPHHETATPQVSLRR
ncbi:heme ABC transporter ATP-binding protein [Lonsdalea quercina]|uniref:heme ABC transporter ATP-binding protein n=1 Tax=Lonsdalea quercina TaxID=71657 RepID=UPI003976E871